MYLYKTMAYSQFILSHQHTLHLYQFSLYFILILLAYRDAYPLLPIVDYTLLIIISFLVVVYSHIHNCNYIQYCRLQKVGLKFVGVALGTLVSQSSTWALLFRTSWKSTTFPSVTDQSACGSTGWTENPFPVWQNIVVSLKLSERRELVLTSFLVWSLCYLSSSPPSVSTRSWVSVLLKD